MSETEDIDSQREEMRGKRPRNYYERNGDNFKSARRIAEALVVSALLGLGASVWLLRESVAVLQTSQAFLQRQMETLDERQVRTAERVNEMSGRVMRGIQNGQDPYAPDKQ